MMMPSYLTKWLNWHDFCFYFFACFLSCNSKNAVSLARCSSPNVAAGIKLWRSLTRYNTTTAEAWCGPLWWFQVSVLMVCLATYFLSISPKIWTNLGRFQVEWVLQQKFHGNFCLTFQWSFINFGKTSKLFNLHAPFNHLESCLPGIWNIQSYCQLLSEKNAWCGLIFVLMKTGLLIMNLF